MSEKNGKPIDFDETDPLTVAHREIARLRGVLAGFRGVVNVGDRFRFTFDAAKFIMNEPESSTVVVELAEIKVEADGSKTLIVVPA